MAVDVLGGALDFVATLDTSELEGQLQSALNSSAGEVNKFNDSLLETAQRTQEAFNTTGVDNFLKKIVDAGRTIKASLEQGFDLGSIDPSKIDVLKREVASTTDEFKQLQFVIGFIKDNISNLKLNPEQLGQLNTAINTVESSFSALQISIPPVAREISALSNSLSEQMAKAFQSGDIDGFIAKIKDSSAEISNSLIGALSHVGDIDPAALTQLNQKVDGTIGEFNKLKAVLEFIQNNLGNLQLSPTQLQAMTALVGNLVTDVNSLSTGNIAALGEALQRDASQIRAFNDQLAQTRTIGAASFDTSNVDVFVSRIQQASATIRTAFQGALAGTSNIDASQLLQVQKDVAGVSDEFQKLDTITKFVQQNLDNLNLPPEELQNLQTAISTLQNANEQVNKIREAGKIVASSIGEGFDTAKLNDFQTGIITTVDSFKQLQTAITFVKDNFKNLNLNPEQLQQLNGAINTVEQSFFQFTQKVQQGVGPLISDISNLSDSFSTGLVKAFQTGDLDGFIQRVKEASVTIRNSLVDALAGVGKIDPAAIDSLKQQIEGTTGEFNKLQQVITFIHDNLGKLDLNPEQLQRMNVIIESLTKNIDAISTGNIQQLQTNLQLSADELKSFNDELSKTGQLNKTAFGQKDANAFIGKIEQAGAVIRTSLEKGLSGVSKIDPSKLFQLQKQVGGTTDEFKKLQIITQFVNQNLDKLNLGDDEIKKLGSAIDTVSQAFEGMGAKEEAPLTRLRQIRNELTQLSTDGVAKTDPRFQALLGEATQLQKSMTEVHKALNLSGQETPGILALQQGFRGLLGGVEAVAGAMGFFNDNSEEAAKITKNLVALMTIFNGVEELSAVLSKNSALNIFLEQKFRHSNAAAAQEEAVALVESNAAKEAGVAITEDATVAQEGLNVAMLANPVALILAGIVALYGAYSILANTIFKASDATQQHRAAIEAYNEAAKKAADVTGEEQGHLEALLVVAKSGNQERAERQRAVDELNQKYPQTLGNLRLETLGEQQTAQAIKETIEQIKKKAQATAAEEVYKERLKDVAKQQAILNDVVANGGTIFQEFFAGIQAGNGASGKLQLIKNKMEDLTEAENKAKGAWDAYIKSVTQSGSPINEALNHIDDQIDAIIATQAKHNDPTFNAKQLKFFQDQKKQIQELNGIITDPHTDSQNDGIISLYQRRADAARKGTADELNARRELVNKEKEIALQDRTLFDNNGDILKGISPEKVKKAEEILGGFQSKINDIGEEFTTRSLKNATSSAQAIVLALQTAGEAGSRKFFEAQRNAIIRAAQEEISQAKDNSGEILRIRAQLNLDLHNLDIQEQTQRLENEKSIINARIALTKDGSDEELQLRLKLLDIAAKEEILQAGDNAAKIQEINATTAKEKFELDKKFTIEANKTSVEIVMAGIDEKLAVVQAGTAEELALKKAAVDEKAKEDELSAKEQIKNEELLQAKIKAIRAKSLADQKKLEDDFFKQLLEKQLSSIQSQADLATGALQTIIDNPVSSLRAKQNAQEQQVKINIDALKKQRQVIFQDLERGKGDANDLETKINELDAKIKKLEGDATNLDTTNQLARLKGMAADLNAVGSALGSLSNEFKGVNDDLADFLAGLSNAAEVASNAISAFTSFSSGDIAGGITSAASALTGIIESFKQVIESEKKAKQEILDFQAGIIAGEEAYNETLRERARQQVLSNKLTLEGLDDQKKLLDEQKKANNAAFNDILKQIQQLDFIAGEKTKKGSLLLQILGGPLDLFGANKTKVDEQLQSLAGKTFDEIEKLFDEGRLTDKAKELFQQLEKLKQEGIDIDTLLAENAEKMKEALTGTTSSNIVDAIADGFSQGKRSAADFAGTFEDLMRAALINSLKLKFLEPRLKDFFDEFANLSQSDGQLTSGEIGQLHDQFNQIINDANSQFRQLQQIAGISLASGSESTNSLAGAIKGIQEQTAELLAGQFAGQRLATLDLVSIQRSALDVMQRVDTNLSLVLQRMNTFLGKYDSYETGAKKLHVVM
jgi:hypothetical protein